MFKKKLLLFLSCLIVLGLSACSKNDVSVSSEDYGESEVEK